MPVLVSEPIFKKAVTSTATGARPVGSDAFRAMVDERAGHLADGPSGVIDSTQPKRFAIFVSKLFEKSRNRIGIFTDHLCRFSSLVPLAKIEQGQPYWTDATVIEKACQFVENEGASLDIIVRKEIDSPAGKSFAGNEFLKEVVEHTRRKARITLYVSGIGSPTRLVGNSFIVADDRVGYRVEQDIDWQKGLGQFGDRETNQELFTALDAMKLLLDQIVANATYKVSPPNRPPMPLRLIYEPGAHDVNSPSLVSPDVNLAEIDLSRYFIDQVSCPPEQVSLLWTGIRTGWNLIRASL